MRKSSHISGMGRAVQSFTDLKNIIISLHSRSLNLLLCIDYCFVNNPSIVHEKQVR